MSPKSSTSSEASKRIQATVMTWPGVRRAKRFRQPAYYVGTEIFLVAKPSSVVLTALPEGELSEARRAFGATPFKWGKRTYNRWCEIRCETGDEAHAIQPLLWASYRGAHQADMDNA